MMPWAKRTIGRMLPPSVEFLLWAMLDTLKSFEQHPAGKHIAALHLISGYSLKHWGMKNFP